MRVNVCVRVCAYDYVCIAEDIDVLEWKKEGEGIRDKGDAVWKNSEDEVMRETVNHRRRTMIALLHRFMRICKWTCTHVWACQLYSPSDNSIFIAVQCFESFHHFVSESVQLV